MVDLQAKQMADDFARRIMQQGLSVEQYFQFTGLSEEKMMEELKPQAEKRIRTRLVLEAIVAAENIEVSDERLDEELAKMAESYKMEVEKLKEFMGENEKKQMKEDIAVQDAVTLIVDASVEANHLLDFLRGCACISGVPFLFSRQSYRKGRIAYEFSTLCH